MPFNPRQVRAEMARKGFTIETLAATSGLATSSISKALGPNGNPTANTIEKLADALEVDEGLFFTPRQHCSVNQATA